MNSKKTLILKILALEILAFFFGWFVREQGRGLYFSMGLIPPAPFWVYDILVPVVWSVVLGFLGALGLLLNNYWAGVERRQRQAELKRRLALTDEVTEEAKA